MLLELELGFRNHVQDRTPPPLGGLGRIKKSLSERFLSSILTPHTTSPDSTADFAGTVQVKFKNFLYVILQYYTPLILDS